MKTLKFMLAAATAIGLASASQAVGPFAGSTDFESYEVGTNITEYSLWSYAGATAADNESVVADAGTVATDVLDADRPANFVGATPRAKILQVSTGTDPILRGLEDGLAPDLASTATIYVDTLVQFTVTPATDTVTPNAADKLMIYLKEDLTAGSESTNLWVVASNYQGVDPLDETETKETVAVNTGVSVEPNTWQRLVVESFVETVDGVSVPVFKIKVGSTQLTSGSDYLFCGSPSDNTLFPSITGMASTTLSAVGFAGEGKVDDLAITTFDPTKTLIDFTLVQSGFLTAPKYSTASGYSNVDIDVGGSSVKTYSDDIVTVTYTKDADHTYEWTGATVTESADGNAVTATFTPANGATVTIAATAVQTGIDFTLTLGQGVSSVSFTVDNTPYEVTTTTNITLAAGTVNYTATFDTANWWTGTNGSFTVAAAPGNAYTVEATRDNAEGVITSTTTAADLGITGGAFASSTQAELTKVVNWAIANGKETSEVSAMTFADPLAPTADEKSYLLGEGLTGVEMTEADAKDALEIASIEYDETEGWVVKCQNDKGAGDTLANGQIKIFGAANVAGPYTEGQENKNFFKAVLVK